MAVSGKDVGQGATRKIVTVYLVPFLGIFGEYKVDGKNRSTFRVPMEECQKGGWGLLGPSFYRWIKGLDPVPDLYRQLCTIDTFEQLDNENRVWCILQREETPFLEFLDGAPPEVR